MNVLVVGGAGFIGSHLVDRLLAEGHSVDVVDDLSSGSLANLAEARSAASSSGGTLKFHHLGVASSEAASLMGMRRPDVVYHLAAVPRGNPDVSQLSSAFAGTMALFDAVRSNRVAKVVVALPASVIYGRPANRDLPVKEQPLEPRGSRGVVARATVDLLSSHREFDAVEFTALALTTVYGPRQRAELGVVAAFARAVEQREAPVIVGDGRQTRDFLFVDDAVDALVRAGSKGSGLVVNIGTGEQTSIRELWDAMSTPASVAPQYSPAAPDHVQRFSVSPIRARIHLSWSPWTSLGEGLAQLRYR
ncbi:MAG TPA: NAD-dependent epimerase/dehydratase family protein [Ilumatobacter sp.]|nr:NAD-dependent epimerase/dehydratase family protein [Ilumatobacter sp.]